MTTQETSNRFACPSCGGKVKVPPSQSGDRFQCPRCGEMITVGGVPPPTRPDESISNDVLYSSHPSPEASSDSVTDQSFEKHDVASDSPPLEDQTNPRDMNEDDEFKLSDAVDRPNMSSLLGELDAKPATTQLPSNPRPAESRQPIHQPKTKEDPLAAHAQELVAKAEAQLDEQERERPSLPENPFRSGAMSFLFQGAALLRLCALSIAVNLVASLVMYWHSAQSGSAVAQIGAVFLFVILTVFSVAFLFATSICCLVIVQDTAYGFNKIENWPGTNFTDWIGDTFYIINALLVSLFPGCLLAQFLFLAGMPVWVFGVFGGISLMLLFPPTLLSMITSASVFAVVSPTIWKSLRTQKQTWRTFYLIAVGFSVASLVAIWMMTWSSVPLSLTGSVLLMALVMIYFRLLGRLAWVIEEQIADEAE